MPRERMVGGGTVPFIPNPKSVGIAGYSKVPTSLLREN